MLFAKTKYTVIYYHSHYVLIANVLESLIQHNATAQFLVRLLENKNIICSPNKAVRNTIMILLLFYILIFNL